MSYARFSEGDAYVWKEKGGKLVCATKKKGKKHKIYETKSEKRMFNHLKALQKGGKKVPARAFSRLKKEIKKR